MEAPPHQLLVSQPLYSSNRCNPRSHRGEGGGPVEISKEASHAKNSESSNTGERLGGAEIGCVTLDSNLASLCDHIHLEGFSNGVFSDVVLNAMGSTYRLHRLIISRSSYFRNMLHGPWKEANSPNLTLHVDDKNVNGEAIEIALAYMYGNYPKLDNTNAFRVLAAASFLDLQDLCAICTDFIISELCSSNFLTYQVFAESQDYGRYGERVRNACWGYLCQSGALELKEVLPKVSPQTLLTLLTSDELWVPSEEKRFELALYTLLAKGTHCIVDHHEQGNSNSEEVSSTHSDSLEIKNKHLVDESGNNLLETEQGRPKSEHEGGGSSTARNIGGLQMGNSVADSYYFVAKDDDTQIRCSENRSESGYNSSSKQTFAHDTHCIDISGSSSFVNIQIDHGMSGSTGSGLTLEGPSTEDTCYQLNNNWSPVDQLHCMSSSSSCDVFKPNEWERCNMPPLTWGGRTVARREVKACQKRQCGMSREDYDAFLNIFEGGSLLYCNMSFEALLNVRKLLEEMGFPCKAVNDGLWLQMLLSQLVHEIGVATCKNCCLVSTACACRQSFGYSRGVTALGCYVQDPDPSNLPNDIGHVYITSPAQGERNDLFRPGRGNVTGLAGIGHGTTFVPATAWPPTRYVFSRVPFGTGNRNNQQAPANDDPENRADNLGDLAGDGLTALVGLNQGPTDIVQELQVGRAFEAGPESITAGLLTPGPSTSGIHVQVIDSTEHAAGIDWENVNNSISLDLKTPLSHFPPFRFAVEFQDVHRLSDGQVKHSPEFCYAGSLWKISVQAFSDEDPQGRRTLGLFLHRRKAEISDQLRKVHMYVDPREKVTARYQLMCPSKREVVIFGSYKQSGTLLPKAPKGWGWRTALLFNQLGDLLQNGALRVAAVVQLI